MTPTSAGTERCASVSAWIKPSAIVPAIAAGLAATVYTQVSDVEDEVNGLVTYDRRVVKADAEVFRAMNNRLRTTEGESWSCEN